MKRFPPLFIYLFFVANLLVHAEEIRHLYQKNYTLPSSSYEFYLLEHVKESLEKALIKESKINALPSHFSRIVMHHLLNNLCSLTGANYLHNGLHTGESFTSALYGNTSLLSKKIGISLIDEDFQEYEFNKKSGQYLNSNSYQILISDLNTPMFKCSVDIYFYDALSRNLSPQETFFYLNSIFSRVFIILIDDWNWEWVREGTFKAFDALSYHLLSEVEIPSSAELGNGHYMAIVKKLHQKDNCKRLSP